MRARGEVSDADWAVLEPLLRFLQLADMRGRPPADTREVLNGVLWILRTGAQWRASGHHFINYARDVASQLESELRGVEAGPSEPISYSVGSLVKTLPS